jgi:hypothetical protein
MLLALFITLGLVTYNEEYPQKNTVKPYNMQ